MADERDGLVNTLIANHSMPRSIAGTRLQLERSAPVKRILFPSIAIVKEDYNGK